MLIPAVQSAITPRSLNALFQASATGLPEVESVLATPLDGGNGYLAQAFRLEIGWNGVGSEEAPRTLVAKLPLPARLEAMTANAKHMYRREAMFHRVVAPVAPMRTPRTWVSELDDSGAAVMVFEDLGRLESFADDETISVERVKRSLVMLAGLHAFYMQSPELDGMDWLAYPAKSDVDQVSAARFDAIWPYMVASGAYELSTAQLHLGEMLRTKMDGVYEALHAGPESLIHADLHQENLFFDGVEPVFIDWALAERASPAKDIAKLTASCLEPGTIGREQPGLLRRYMEELRNRAAGAISTEERGPNVRSGLSFDELSNLTHLATCHYMAMALFLGDRLGHRDFFAMASNTEGRTDVTTSRLVAACDRDEMVAAVERI